MIRLAILGSTRGTTLLKILSAIQSGGLHATLVTVISNKADALILENAAKAGFQAQFISPAAHTRESYDEVLSKTLKDLRIDLIVLIGYMRILSSNFVNTWHQKVINVHPSLLPAFSGLMNDSVHAAVLTAKKTVSGCTVHYVTENVDAGPIILQKTCPVMVTDNVDSLKARVQALEGPLLIEAIQHISQLSVEGKKHGSR